MKIISPIPRKRGRIEIIPLIDIMFFLLAAFMMISIHMIKIKSLKIALPTEVPVAQLEPKEDFISISINTLGQVQLDKELLTNPNTMLLPKLQAYYAKNKDQKFLISADKDSRHGDVVAVLGKLREAGFQRVAFSLKSGPPPPSQSGTGVAPPSAPAPPSGPAPATPAAPAPAPAPSATAPATPPAPDATPAPVAPAPAPAAAPAPASPSKP